jgi:undecaprenyl-diphosphatase
MNWVQALLLGIVQGVTEFVPVSSSAHLKILKYLFDLPTENVLFDLFCHVGTIAALAWYFRRDIVHLFTQEPRALGLYATALTPLVPLYFLLKPLREALSHFNLLGYFLLLTSAFLFLAPRFKPKNTVLGFKSALLIGTAQGLALIPGISRSAATITGGLCQGFSAKQAVRFSFLLSLPAVTGGTFLELFKAKHLLFSPLYLIGLTSSFTIGTIVIRYAIPWLEKARFKPFAWYCLIVAIMLILFV